MTKRAKQKQQMLGQFTKQLRNEYLLDLRESAKLSVKPSKDTIKILIKIDDIANLNNSTKRVFGSFSPEFQAERILKLSL